MSSKGLQCGRKLTIGLKVPELSLLQRLLYTLLPPDVQGCRVGSPGLLMRFVLHGGTLLSICCPAHTATVCACFWSSTLQAPTSLTSDICLPAPAHGTAMMLHRGNLQYPAFYGNHWDSR